jgi:cyclopropane-fatty-acyl-phospholipid synthase
MTDILPATWPATARDPELRRAPAAFRTALRVAVENWAAGDLTFVLPSGKALRIVGKTPGPDAVIRIHDYRFIRRPWPPATSASRRATWPASGTRPTCRSCSRPSR